MRDFEAVAVHVVRARDLPPGAVAAVGTFLLDTLGVGIAGSSGAGVGALVGLARDWGPGDEATVWLTGERMSAGSAAIVNAYMIHCLEFDCVHEGAVLHPMATRLILPWKMKRSTSLVSMIARCASDSIVTGEMLIVRDIEKCPFSLLL